MTHILIQKTHIRPVSAGSAGAADVAGIIELCPLLCTIECLFKPEYRKKYRESCRNFLLHYNTEVLRVSTTGTSNSNINKKKRNEEVEVGNKKKKKKSNR